LRTIRPLLYIIAYTLFAVGWAGSSLSSQAPQAAQAATTSSTLVYLPLIRQSSAPKLVFGLGPTASSAKSAALASQAPLGLLTTWYNGPNDLIWMAYWKKGTIPQSYAAGYALHVIVYVGGAESTVETSYGAACGRPYPLSAGFLDDMRTLAQTFAGAANGPPLYVTLFTEFQTYACTDNAWNPNAPTNAYYRALKDRYLEALTVFHQNAPNARVSLGWGGWQTRWDDPAIGAGRSMFQYFDDVMHASDFQSFQAMSGEGNAGDVRAMVKRLGGYGPVMLAHYKPDNGDQAVFESDLQTMLTDAYLAEVTRDGLFAWSFMDDKNLKSSSSILQFTIHAIQRYGR
jgi:hypothetical protein